VIDSGLVGATDFHSSHPQGYDAGRGVTTAEGAQGTPTQSHISPSILVYEDKLEARSTRGGPSPLSKTANSVCVRVACLGIVGY